MELFNADYMELLIKIGPGILTAIIGFLSGYQLHKIKSRDEIRQKHFNEIKQRVLQPVLKLINQYYIPVLQHEMGALYVKRVPIYEEESIMKPPVSGLRDEIAIREPSVHEEGQGLIHKMYKIPKPSYIDEHLFTDVMDHHYPASVDQFEKIQEDFDKYNDSCRVYAEELKREIASKAGLPERIPGDYSQEKWINANELSIFIFERQLGIGSYEYLRSGPGQRGHFVLSLGSNTVAQGTEAEMETVTSLIDGLAKQTTRSQELVAAAEALLENVIKIKDNLEKLLLTHKLSGTCSYCKI